MTRIVIVGLICQSHYLNGISLFSKGVAGRGSRTKGRRGGVRPKAEKKKGPPPIWGWKWSATCLLQLWQLRMSLRYVPVLVRMPTLRTAMPNSSEGILLMTNGIQTQEVCTGKFRHMGWGLGCLIQITKNIATFTSHGPYILHIRKIDFWACKESIQNVSQLQLCQRQSSATMVPWPSVVPVAQLFLATCTMSTCHAHLPVSLSLYCNFVPLMINIRLKKLTRILLHNIVAWQATVQPRWAFYSDP